MTRSEGWERRLADYIAAAIDRPFAWGSHDCALWAATWVDLATGSTFAAEWAGLYKTQAGAWNAMKTRGFSGVAGIADRHLEGIPVNRASRGDLVLHPQGALGICHGVRSYFVTESGLAAEKTLACTRAWAVG